MSSAFRYHTPEGEPATEPQAIALVAISAHWMARGFEPSEGDLIGFRPEISSSTIERLRLRGLLALNRKCPTARGWRYVMGRSSAAVRIRCEHCGKVFSVTTGKAYLRRFCSSECKIEAATDRRRSA